MSVYVVMWNLPGCLPEMEPMEYETFGEARDGFIDALRMVAVGDTEFSAAFEEKADAMELSGDAEAFASDYYWDGPDGYVYSITAEDNTALEEIEILPPPFD